MKIIRKKEDGQALVEAALVIPIFLLVVCAIIDFGWIFTHQQMIDNCSREGARYAVIHEDESNFETATVSWIRSMATIDDGSDLNINVNTVNNNIEVTVSMDVPLLTPVVGIFTSSETFFVDSTSVLSLG